MDTPEDYKREFDALRTKSEQLAEETAALKRESNKATERLSDGVARIKSLNKRLALLPKGCSDYYNTVSEIAKLNPEPGYALLTNAAIGIHLVDSNGIVLWANAHELEALGYKPEDYFGRSITDFHMDADVIQHILDTLSGGQMLNTYPAQLKAKNGSSIYVLINSSVFENDDSFVHTRCFTIQVTEDVYNARKCCDIIGCPHKTP